MLWRATALHQHRKAVTAAQQQQQQQQPRMYLQQQQQPHQGCSFSTNSTSPGAGRDAGQAA
jgi:hypothetical protein